MTATGRPSTDSLRARVLGWVANDGIWVVVGIAAAAFTVLREAGSLLSRIGDAAGVGYSTTVFTGPTLAVGRTGNLAAALRLWTAGIPVGAGDGADDGSADGVAGVVAEDVELATRLLGVHVITDFVFIAAYGVILWRLLRWVGAGRSFAVGGPLAMAAADYVETTVLGAVVATGGGDAPTVALLAIQAFAALKWLALAVITVGALVNLFRDDRRHRPRDALGFELQGGRSPLHPDGPLPSGGGSVPVEDDEAPTDPTAAAPSVSTKAIIESVQGARAHGDIPAPIAVTGQLVLIGLFCVLIALPGGSALAQTPDVLRVQIDPVIDGDLWPNARPFLLSTVALGLFAVASVTSAVIGGPVPTARRKTIGSAIPLAGAVVVSGLLALSGLVLDGSPSVASWALVIVVAGVAIAAWIATLATGDRDEDVTGPETIPSRWQTGSGPSSVGGGPPNLLVSPEGLSRWASALAAVVMIAGGVGLLRAAVPIVMLGDRSRWWWAFAGLGVVVVVTGGIAAQGILSTGIVPRILTGGRRRRFAIGTAIVAVVVGLAAWLAIDPSAARHWGTTGAVTIGFSFYVLVIGALQRLARQGRPWRATQRLGFGVTTPWTLLLVVVWAIGSLLNTRSGYHELDLLTEPALSESRSTGDDDGRHSSIDEAFDTWLATNVATECGDPSAIPLVMVAAPGGGIRAAYWTGTTLEALLPGSCRDRLFIASGTSGGAVGIATWASASAEPAGPGPPPEAAGDPTAGSASGAVSEADRPTTGADPTAGSAPATASEADRPTTDALVAMSRDDPLAATVAALLLRDLPQPLTGLRTAWDDRGGVLESRWVDVTAAAAASQRPRSEPEAAGTGGEPPGRDERGDDGGGVFGQPGAPRSMRDLGPPAEGWAPIVVLNSASVIDGCRALITTLDDQPTVGNGDCLATTPALAPSMMPDQEQPAGRPVTGVSGASIDVLDRLTVEGAGCEPDDRPRPELPVVTGALAAARFPYITPSGSVRYCVNEIERELYLVDGGYFENTGLLAVLEVWNEIEPRVEAHNADPDNRPIVPWILYLDNSYRQNQPATDEGRPLELLVPVRTFFQNQVASPAALQQQAAAAMIDFGSNRNCAGGGYTRLGPEARPEVAAPLGWVLSAASRDSLDGFRVDALGRDDTCLAALTGLLGVREP